jgi:acyl carrier protein
MDKEFYLRGPKWQPTVEYPNDITVLKEIINCHNGLLNIELENITYPFDAYVVFDIAALQIIEGKTSRDRNLIPDNTSQEKKDDGIFVKIRQIMVDVFGVDENLIEMDKNIVDYSYYIPDYTGLGTGLEAFDLLFSLEECFNIKIPDDEFEDLANSKTIGDLCEYIRKKTIEKGGNAV